MAEGDLCYAKTSPQLAYCKRSGYDAGKLIYKRERLRFLVVTLSSYNPSETLHSDPEYDPDLYPTSVISVWNPGGFRVFSEGETIAQALPQGAGVSTMTIRLYQDNLDWNEEEGRHTLKRMSAVYTVKQDDAVVSSGTLSFTDDNEALMTVTVTDYNITGVSVVYRSRQ